MTYSSIVRRACTPKWTIFFGVLPLPFLSACSSIFGGDCVDVSAPAIGISVIDARSQQSILDGTTIILLHNGLRDSVTVQNPVPATESFVAFSESGSFTIIVRHAGFQELTMNDVVVDTDRCGQPKTVHVTAGLTP